MKTQDYTHADDTGLESVRFVKRISIGSINPNRAVGEEAQEKQMELLNKCLNDHPHGRIIGKDIAVGVFRIGEHEISLQRITYHVGFNRKPYWLEDMGDKTYV